MKKFTLIEIIVTIVALSIILAIIMVNFFDIKKKTITNTMAQNISIMQGMVDTYYIKENTYPIPNEKTLSLENPQLIDIEMLLDSGVQKKDLDTSKIEDQYYWVDVFGKVWGSTENSVESISLIENSNSYNLEALINENYIGYNIYEINGYSVSSKANSNLEANKEKDSKYYRLIEEFEVSVSGPNYINYKYDGQGSTYLVSFIDEYGLESAPMGKLAGGTTFKPIIKGEGEYEFEIESEDTMYWIDFRTLEDKPGKSTIDYLFTVKDENGNYIEEWTDDYFSLDPSKGIKVKVIMKGDNEGNLPSLYDLHIIFKYEDDPVPPIAPDQPKEKTPEGFVCPAPTMKSSFGRYSSSLKNGDTGQMVYSFYVQDFETVEEVYVPTVDFYTNIKFEILDKTLYVSEDNVSFSKYSNQETSGKCMFVVYDVKILSFKKPVEDKSTLCGSGGSHTYYNGNQKQIVYSMYLDKEEYLTKIDRPLNHPNWILKSIKIEMSHKGADYIQVSSISEVKDESCVKIVFNYTGLSGFPPTPPAVDTCQGDNCRPPVCVEECVPVCKVNCTEKPKEPSWCDSNPTASGCIPYCLQVEGKCVPPVCTVDCRQTPPDKPNPDDKELHDPEWTTVNTLKFFGHGATGQLTRWYKAEHTDSIVKEASTEEISLLGDTRIVYRYSKSSGSYWSNEYPDFTTTEYAARVMAKAYVQVRTTKVDEVPVETYPTVSMMKFYNEKGVVDVSMVQPTVVILPIKDNNVGREVFSDESNIDWQYEAADPRNKEIIKVEWDGDIRSKYPVGTYEVKIRVQNEMAYWSEWTSFKFEVLPEKPIAKIGYVVKKGSSKYLDTTSEITWTLSESTDPDGDGIAKFEWKGDKKSMYTEGDYVISLRVQDKEGYWSDWVDYKLHIGGLAYNIFRYEGEDPNLNKVTSENYISTSDKYSGGKGKILGEQDNVTFTFVGTGYDLVSPKSNTLRVDRLKDGVVQDSLTFNHDGEEVISVRGLPLGEYTVVATGYYRGTPIIDYIDVYSSDDKPKVLGEASYMVTDNGYVNKNIKTNQFSVTNGQKIRYAYTQLKNSHVTVEVYDKSNKLIKVLQKNKYQLGGTINYYEIDWDGTDSSNNKMQTGEYEIRLAFKGVGEGTILKHSYTVRLDNEVSIFRYEGEDLKLNTFNVTNYQAYSANYSDGKGRILGEKNTVSFTFEGTGYDLSIGKASTLDITLSQGGVVLTTTRFNHADPEFLSVRDLPLGIYTVTATAYYRGTPVIDYIDVYSSDDKPKVLSEASYMVTADNYVNKDLKTNQFSVNNNQKIRYAYSQLKNAYVTVEVYDSSNKLVKKLQDGKYQLGGSTNYYEIDWDGKNSDNQKVKTGEYKIKTSLKGVGAGAIQTNSYMVKLDNEIPIFRYEGEDIKLNSFNVTNYQAYSDTYSEGKGRILGEKNTVSFTFEGTGYDFAIGKASTLDITLSQNGVVLTTTRFNHANPEFLSVRDLPLGPYTVTATAYYRGTPVIDYIDIYSSDDKPAFLSSNSYMINKDGTFNKDLKTKLFSSYIGQSIVHEYTQLKNAYVTVEVYDSSNRLVKTLQKDKYQLGGSTNAYESIWDGTNNSNNKVETGKYTIKTKLEGVGEGLVNEMTYIVELDNEKPSIRFEAEDTTINKMPNSNYLILSDLYSGGGARSLGEKNIISFTFTGTGYDIVSVKSNTLDLVLKQNGVVLSSLRLNHSGGETISVRNLPYGEYTVTAQSYLRGNPRIDYIDVYGVK